MNTNDLFKFVSLRQSKDATGSQPDEPNILRRRQQEVHARQSETLASRSRVGISERGRRMQHAKQRRAELVKLIDQHEAIQRIVYATYVTQHREQAAAAPAKTSPRDPNARAAPEARSAVVAMRPGALTIDFASAVAAKLPSDQMTVFNNVTSRLPAGGAGVVDLDMLLNGLEVDPLIGEANALCLELRALEEPDGKDLPTVPPASASAPRPLVSAVGWGDLVVARERLVGYVAREVAHIENVLPGEEKFREHERTAKTEQVDEVETITEKESEKDSQSTDRYELQSQSQETISRDFAIKAGVNTSGRYGLTNVDTSLDSSFQQSQSQSHNNSVNTAREIVSKAVERTFERVRKLRRLTITEEIRELNRHGLSNVGQPRQPISGVYLWVEKVQEVELRHYGTRLMLEFHIPEPALSLHERGQRQTMRRRLPIFDIGPTGIEFANYLCLAQRYGATDIGPPPPLFVKVGFTWASASNEETEDWGESTIAEMINVPDGYRPKSGTIYASALPTSTYDFSLAVGGVRVVEAPGTLEVNTTFDLPAVYAWPQGVPVSARVHGAGDNAMAVQVTLLCERTPEAVTAWQLRTWEALKAGYEAMARKVALDMQQEALDRSLIEFAAEQTASENRRVERSELQKWAIKAMRLKPQNFNAIERVGEMQEVNPLEADLQAPIVRFFGDAFEWEHMSYFLYPYHWARRESWAMRNAVDAVDATFKAFLEAGAARMIVPVTPGYEAKVLSFLEADPSADELSRIAAAAPLTAPPDTLAPDIWVEILTDRIADLALGSGTLSVQQGSPDVRISDDSKWRAGTRDLGRELYIAGDRYVIAAVIDGQRIQLGRTYGATTDAAAVYAAGSVPFGPPWTVNVPTTLIVLADNVPALQSI